MSSSGMCPFTNDCSHIQVIFQLRGTGELCMSLQNGSTLGQSSGLFITHMWKEQSTGDCIHFFLSNLETVLA